VGGVPIKVEGKLLIRIGVNIRYVGTWLLAVVLFFVLGCGQESKEVSKAEEGPTVVRAVFWGVAALRTTTNVLQDITDGFNKAHPDIHVEVEFIPVPDYKTRAFLEMGSDNPPDVFMTWAGGFLETFVEGGKVFSLSEALENDLEWQKRFFPGAFDQLTVNDQIYAVPNAEVVTALFYNKRIFKELELLPPATFNDLIEMAPLLRSHGYIPLAFGNEEPWVGGMLAGVMAQRVGGLEPYRRLVKTGSGWGDQTYIETGKLLQRLKNNNVFPENFNSLTYGSAFESFSEGRAAMIIMGSWIIPEFTHSAIVKDGVGVAPIPMVKGGKGKGSIWMGQVDRNLGISTQSKNKEAALKYLKWFSSPYEQRRLIEATGNLMVANIGENPPRVPQVTLDLMGLLKYKQRTFLFYDVGFGQGVGVAFNRTIKEILDGVPPKQAFGELEEAVRMTRESEQVKQ